MSNIEWLPRSSSDQTQSYKDSYGQPAWHQEAPLDSPSPPDTPSASSSRPPFDLRICDYSSTTASMSNLGFDPTGGATRSSHTRTNTDPSFAFASGPTKDEALIDLEAAAGRGRHAHHLSVSSSCGISSVGGGSTSGGSSDLDNESEWHTFASQQGLDRRGISSSSSSSSAANPEDLYTGLSRAFSQHHLTGGGPAAAGFPGASFKFEDFIASDVDGNNIDPALRGAHQHQQHRSESTLFAAGMAQNQFAPEWMAMAGVKDELNLTHHSIGEPSWDPQQASYGGGSSTNTDSPLIVAGFAGHYATNPEIVESTAARPFTLVRSMSLQGHHPSSSNVHHHSSPSGGSEVHLASTGRVLPIHPALLRAGRPDYSTRSNSSPNVHEPSCNPSQITPGDYGFIDSTQSSPVFTSNVFNRYDLPDSPASSSAFSSPLTWHTPLHSDDGYGGEETYRPQHAGFASAQQQAMSSSMPSLVHSHHDGSPAWLSVSTSPSGFAGQAIRSSSSRPTTAGTPYDSPSIRATTSTARERRSAAQQQQPPVQTQDPYSGVITKRSRGRRVPKTPEEMTNVAKSGKVYSCRVPGCGLLFKRSEHLRRHLRSIHTNEKPFQCPVCSKAFSRRDNVHQHLKVHGASGRSARSAVPSRAVSLDGASGTAGSESPSGSPLEDWQRSRGGTVTRRNHGRPGGIIDDGVFAFDNGDDDDEDDDLHDFTL